MRVPRVCVSSIRHSRKAHQSQDTVNFHSLMILSSEKTTKISRTSRSPRFHRFQISSDPGLRQACTCDITTQPTATTTTTTNHCPPPPHFDPSQIRNLSSPHQSRARRPCLPSVDSSSKAGAAMGTSASSSTPACQPAPATEAPLMPESPYPSQISTYYCPDE